MILKSIIINQKEAANYQMMDQNSKRTNVTYVSKDGKVDQVDNYNQNLDNQDMCEIIVESLTSDEDFNHQWMIEIDDNFKQTQQFKGESLIGHTHIIVGHPLSGKYGLVFWKQKYIMNCHIITINCAYHPSPYSLVCQLVEQISVILQQNIKKSKNKTKQKNNVIQDIEQLSKKIVIENSVNLAALNSFIRAKPNYKFLFVMKNAQKLVDSKQDIKKQTILYNFLQWIKTDIKDQIGLVFITRVLTFVDSLQKRVKSRMNAKTICVFGISNPKKIIQAIVKRFAFMSKRLHDQNKKTMRKLIQMFEKSAVVQRLIKQQLNRSFAKSINFYLQIFNGVFSIKTSDNLLQKILKDTKEFDNFIERNYNLAKLHLRPFCKEQLLMFRQMNIPEFIIMAIVRKMMIDGKLKISFKEINKQIITFRKNYYNKSGSSFDLPQNLFERSLRGLNTHRIIDMYNKHDFDNADILSNLTPDQIKEAIQGREDLPQQLRDLLN